jgi:hypothetical protein
MVHDFTGKKKGLYLFKCSKYGAFTQPFYSPKICINGFLSLRQKRDESSPKYFKEIADFSMQA